MDINGIRQRAEEGNMASQAILGSMYLFGTDPGDEDVDEAKCYLTAIDGHEIALINLLEWDPLPRVRARAADELSYLYFSAAECLGDSYLLPSVITAAERWRQTEHYEDLEEDTAIQSAIDYLTKVANGDFEEVDQANEKDDDAMDDGE